MTTDTEELNRRVSEIERQLAELKSAILERDKLPWCNALSASLRGTQSTPRLFVSARNSDGPSAPGVSRDGLPP